MPEEQAIKYCVQYSLEDYTFPTDAKAEKLRFDDTHMHIHMTDGRILSVPLQWIPTLYHAQPDDREKYTIGWDGKLLTWDPDESGINEDLPISVWLKGGEPAET
jgi:hypothetical protein